MAQIQEGAPWWLTLSLRAAASSPGTWILSRSLPRVDRVIQRLSDGSFTLQQVLARMGTPVVELTTIGAKTGKLRQVPVLGLRDGEKWVLVASNWGRPTHPGWYHNLHVNPTVQVVYRGHVGVYEAREVTGDERARYWPKITAINPGLETYSDRAGDREIPVIVLTPTEDGLAESGDSGARETQP